MMANTKLYLAHCLLLVTLNCSVWNMGICSPVLAHNIRITEECLSSTQTLLKNITNALIEENLFRGINCTSGMELNTGTQTVSFCMPNVANHLSTCSGLKIEEFDQNECLKNIEKDLRCYGEMLHVFETKLLVTNVLKNIRNIKQNCFSQVLGDSPYQQDTEGCKSTPAISNIDSFDGRVHLCKVLKGFHVRTTTINRIMGYIHAGELM